MAYDSGGTFVALTAPTYPAVDGTTIVASYYNSVITDLIGGLNLAYCRDGRAAATGNFAMGNFKLTGLGNGSAATDSITFGQVAGLLANLSVSTTAVLPANTTIGTVSAADILTLVNVTGDIQAQLDLKAALASPALTGVPTAPTAALGTNTAQIATMAAIFNQVMAATLPGQGGNSGKYLTTDGTNASWGALSVNGGATVTNPMSADIVLTSASTRIQVVTPSVAGWKFTLPDATTMSTNKGSPAFVFVNAGVFPVRVVANGGDTIALVGAKQVAAVSIGDASVAAGDWKAQNATYDGQALAQAYNGSMVALSASAINSAVGRIAVAPISANKFMLCWVDNGASLSRAAIVDIAGNVPTVGATGNFLSGAATFISVCVLSTTQAIVSYQDGGSTGGQSKVINFSGSTISSFGTAFNHSATANTNANSVQALTATTAIVMWNDTSNNLRVKHLTVTGSTITGGTAADIRAATATAFQTIIMLTATKCVCTYQLSSSTFLWAIVLDISGTTITPAGDVALNALASTEVVAASLLEGTNFVISYVRATTDIQAIRVSVSGTTFTLSNVLTVRAVNATALNMNFWNGRKVVLSFVQPTTSYIETAIITAIQTDFSIVSTAYNVLNATASNFPVLGVTPNGKQLAVYRNNGTTFGNLVVTELLG